MDIDLTTNGPSIKDAVSSLQSGKSSWIVLGYDGGKTIHVVETGDDSLEDMFEEFTNSEVMYGFASVLDPNTKLKKTIFIHWQGQGAQQVMKTKSMQHSNIIRDLYKPIHVTVAARHDQDLDLKEIMSKVAAASGSNYSYHDEKKQIYETQPRLKSQSSTAGSVREERQKELASLNSVKREWNPPPPKKELKKINPADDIKASMNNPTSFPKPTSSYQKINPEREFKSLNLNQKSSYESAARLPSENNTAERAREERKKELMQLSSRTFVDEPFDKVGTNYTKINPTADIQKLRRQSQSTDTDIPPISPGANVKKIDAKNEIAKLRQGSVSNESDVNFGSVSSSYKKIDPLTEIQALRRMSKTNEPDVPVSPSSNYKKINPAEEIRQLRSQNSFNFNEPKPTQNNKINPTEEIKNAKKNVVYREENEEKKPQPFSSLNEPKSARMTFEHMNKSKEEPPKFKSSNKVSETPELRFKETKRDSNTRFSDMRDDNLDRGMNFDKSEENRKDRTENFTENHFLHNKVDTPISVNKNEEKLDETDQSLFDTYTRSDKKDKEQPNRVVNESASPKMEPSKQGVTAKAIFEYEANDDDEIGFSVDEMITNIEQIDEGWWVGVNAAGNKGMFPSNYVHILETIDHPVIEPHDDTIEMNPSESSQVSKIADSHVDSKIFDTLTAVAIYNYEGLQEDEISFGEGDQIYNIEQVDDGWWVGETANGLRGMFPANYVNIVD